MLQHEHRQAMYMHFIFSASMDLFYFVKEPGIKADYDNCWLQE